MADSFQSVADKFEQGLKEPESADAVTPAAEPAAAEPPDEAPAEVADGETPAPENATPDEWEEIKRQYKPSELKALIDAGKNPQAALRSANERNRETKELRGLRELLEQSAITQARTSESVSMFMDAMSRLGVNRSRGGDDLGSDDEPVTGTAPRRDPRMEQLTHAMQQTRQELAAMQWNGHEQRAANIIKDEVSKLGDLANHPKTAARLCRDVLQRLKFDRSLAHVKADDDSIREAVAELVPEEAAAYQEFGQHVLSSWKGNHGPAKRSQAAPTSRQSAPPGPAAAKKPLHNWNTQRGFDALVDDLEARLKTG